MGKLEDLTGQKFGKLTVLEYVGRDKCRHSIWKCLCECGNISFPLATSLKSGVTKSCGCQESVFLPGHKRNKTHGLTLDPYTKRMYTTLQKMKRRCNLPSNPDYHNYGGRGIYVCDEWDDPEVFYNWAIANGYKPELTIDRIDNDGPYAPWNCRWATNEQQQNNKQNTVRFELGGILYTWLDLADRCVVSKETFKLRISRGWSTEKALFTPLRIWPSQIKTDEVN